MSDTESMSERELAQYLTEQVFTDQPRSVGEALAAADDPTPPIEPAPDPQSPPPSEETPPEPSPHEEPPVVVTDTPEQPVPVEVPQPPPSDEPGRDDEKEEYVLEGDELEEEEAPHVAWATKKYGDNPDKWAKAAFDQEQHISRMGNQLKEAEALAVQWYEYAQQAEAQATQTQQMGMPMSSQEEAWVEQATVNPLEYARQAAFNGNVNLFNAILSRVAEENPGFAANIGAQVQMELRQAADAEMAQGNGQAPMTLQQALGGSFQRLGINLDQAGPSMSEKIAELGEYHPYVQAILGMDDGQRDLAVQAVYDLTRAGTLTKRVVRDEQRAEQIKREGELRREAAGVVQGSPHVAPQKEDPFMAAMEQEWRDRRQWGGE
jgi:hypothetical protein